MHASLPSAASFSRPRLPSEGTGDRRVRPTRPLLGLWGRKNDRPQGVAVSIRDDISGVAEGGPALIAALGPATAAPSLPLSGFPLSDAS